MIQNDSVNDSLWRQIMTVFIFVSFFSEFSGFIPLHEILFGMRYSKCGIWKPLRETRTGRAMGPEELGVLLWWSAQLFRSVIKYFSRQICERTLPHSPFIAPAAATLAAVATRGRKNSEFSRNCRGHQQAGSFRLWSIFEPIYERTLTHPTYMRPAFSDVRLLSGCVGKQEQPPSSFDAFVVVDTDHEIYFKSISEKTFIHPTYIAPAASSTSGIWAVARSGRCCEAQDWRNCGTS